MWDYLTKFCTSTNISGKDSFTRHLPLSLVRVRELVSFRDFPHDLGTRVAGFVL